MQNPNAQFEIPGIARIETGPGSLSKIIITTPHAGAEIYTHGAHVAGYEPAGCQPVLWMSGSSWFDAEKPIRGGVPVCFPWFGPRAGDPKSPAHGFARLREWKVESIKQTGDAVVATLMLQSDDATRVIWNADFVARLVVSVGSSLEMKLVIQNRGGSPIEFEQALHTYLTVGDVRRITIDGLGGATYLDKMDSAKSKVQTDPQIRLTGETDRVYLDTTATCIVTDPAMNRRIEISKTGSNATVVWNPWVDKSRAMPDFGDDEWPGMVCVETANVGKHAIRLAAGGMQTMSAKVRLI